MPEWVRLASHLAGGKCWGMWGLMICEGLDEGMKERCGGQISGYDG